MNEIPKNWSELRREPKADLREGVCACVAVERPRTIMYNVLDKGKGPLYGIDIA